MIFMGGSLISYLACILLSLAAGIAIAFPLGIQYRKKVAEAELGTAEEEAKRIVGDAIKDAEVKKKEALVEAKDEIHKQRTEAEKEVKERRNEVQRLERRVQQKEESVDRKLDNLEKKEETLQNKIKEAESKLKEAAEIKANQFEVLEKISGYTAVISASSNGMVYMPCSSFRAGGTNCDFSFSHFSGWTSG